MFQHKRRVRHLCNYIHVRVKHAVQLPEVVSAFQTLHTLIRDEVQLLEVIRLEMAASDAFGVNIQDLIEGEV